MNNPPKVIALRSALKILAGLVIIFLSGCVTVGPDYVPSKAAVGPAWNSPLQGGLNERSDTKRLAAWWTTLNDPLLNDLIELAVIQNHDIKKARARIREARARRGLSRTNLYPALDASGSVSRSRSSSETVGASSTDLFSADLDASWEIDLFGGVRRSVEAADASVQAAGEDLRDTLVTLLAEIAINYVDLRAAQARLILAEASIESQDQTSRLAAWRFQAGLGDRLAVEQSLYALNSERAVLPTLRITIEEARNRLAILLGEAPGNLPGGLGTAGSVPAVPLEVAVGVPADLLRQRPDIRKAERELASQTAQIGVATAELYPKLKLNGAIGLQALNFSGLFNGGGKTSGASAGITWRIFDAGAIRRNIEIQSALQEQYLIAYESAVLAALEEAENAITAYAQEQMRRQSLAGAVRSAKKSSDLVKIKYRAGLIDFTTVLETERSLLSFRDQLIQSDRAVVTYLIKLYKALGGGWTPSAAIESGTSPNGDIS